MMFMGAGVRKRVCAVAKFTEYYSEGLIRKSCLNEHNEPVFQIMGKSQVFNSVELYIVFYSNIVKILSASQRSPNSDIKILGCATSDVWGNKLFKMFRVSKQPHGTLQAIPSSAYELPMAFCVSKDGARKDCNRSHRGMLHQPRTKC